MSPLVSIIIPCFNAACWLAATLESALAQTWTPVEIIVVDDGSTDNSFEIARRYVGDRLSIITQTNAGASAARNAGLRRARGEFIQFLDADDLLASDKIERQMEKLTSAPAGSVASGSWGSFTSDPTQARFQREPVWADFAAIDWLICSWEGGGMMHPAAWLTPRAVADAAGPWNESLSLDDDGEYFCRVLLRSSGIRFVPEARSYYRSHDGARLSASRGGKAAQSSFDSCTSKESQLRAVEDSTRTRRACAHNYARLTWEQLAAAPILATSAEARWRALDAGVPPPTAGRLYNLFAGLIGWKRARRMQLWLHRKSR